MHSNSSDLKIFQAQLHSRTNAEVRFSPGDLAMYATDASNYRQVPVGVVIPKTVDDVIATVALCREFGFPLFGRGAGTSLAGQCCNAAVCVDFSKYLNRVLEIDPVTRIATVEPGVILDDVRREAEKHGLTFGPDPATHDRCTLGGMIGNNSCGIHSIMAGRTSDNIAALEILTYDGARMWVGKTSDEELDQIISDGGARGEIYKQLLALREQYAELVRTRYPDIPRRVSGYNLDELLPEKEFNVARALVGSEGTCVTILQAKLNLVQSPPSRSLVVLGYDDVFTAADQVPAILEHKPVGLEGMDDYLLNFLRAKQAQRIGQIHARPSVKDSIEEEAGKPRKNKNASDVLPDGKAWLLVEFGGNSPDEAESKSQGLSEALSTQTNAPAAKIMKDPKEEALVWEVRKSGLGATAFLPNGKNTWPGWEDAAVRPDQLGSYLREFSVLRDRYGYESAMYGHFGDGCVHMRIDFDLTTRAGIDKFLGFMDEAADLVVKYGGSLSGEHGDGQARAHLLPKMFGPEVVHAFRTFKRIWDPTNMMNPGKLVDSLAPDENLKLGAGYTPAAPLTHFKFMESDGKLGRAIQRCVGVGRCRRLDTGTMCPSFMVTREEKHSTRGRARVFGEMLRGEIIRDGWNSEDLKDALDLCLACKGCKSDCPVNVDMATYKAEFLAHYYEGRFRPPAAYGPALIHIWARLASFVPTMVNAIVQTPLISVIIKRLGGIAPERKLPIFARKTFKKCFKARKLQDTGNKPTVILWPDTFNNHFNPAAGMAAVSVLEAAGFRVVVPEANLCCGRPLYDQGMLHMAKRLLQKVMDTLGPEIDAGLPIVGLEPSCAAVFRDELPNLFPNDTRAQKLSRQVYLLAEFLEEFAPDWNMPKLQRTALLHGHCHQKAIVGMAHDEAVLKRMGIEYTAPDSGCCGMAGSFGFSKKHFGVSVAIGERVLLPEVRAASPDTLIVTDGFSCREQIEQCTGRQVLHLAQVIEKAMKAKPEKPER